MLVQWPGKDDAEDEVEPGADREEATALANLVVPLLRKKVFICNLLSSWLCQLWLRFHSHSHSLPTGWKRLTLKWNQFWQRCPQCVSVNKIIVSNRPFHYYVIRSAHLYIYNRVLYFRIKRRVVFKYYLQYLQIQMWTSQGESLEHRSGGSLRLRNPCLIKDSVIKVKTK